MPSPDAVQLYLHETLGIRVAIRAWSGARKLPYFLQEAFELYELSLHDRRMLLAVKRRKKAHALTTVRDHLEKLKAASGVPVIYVADSLASYERGRLIEQKVPFIVPGNQLYLPDLGIDLREYFRQRSRAAERMLSPATQVMLIKTLLEKSTQMAWQPTVIAAELGYTAMTVSRAVQELTGAGIATLDRRGTARWLRTDRPPAQTWEKAKPLLRSPVKREVWLKAAERLNRKRVALAGLSALAGYSNLVEPAFPIYAMSVAQLKTLGAEDLEELPEPLPGSCQMQVWTYAPILARNVKQAVDPLSLSLSFQEASDERIELALEELKEHFPW